MRVAILVLCLSACLVGNPAAQPLFDAHLHYDETDAAAFSPSQIIAKLNDSGVIGAAICGMPPQTIGPLHEEAPDRIVPLLGVYDRARDKTTWMNDQHLPDKVADSLANGPWAGIGELHIFAKDRNSPVFLRILRLAEQHGIPVLLHADPAVIDTAYDHAPGVDISWAHAGTFPYPDLVSDYLERYPRLYIDLSVRDSRIAGPEGLRDEWFELMVTFPNRVMVGVDTYSRSRWESYQQHAQTIKGWLSLLPDDIAAQIGHRNAAKFFRIDRPSR